MLAQIWIISSKILLVHFLLKEININRTSFFFIVKNVIGRDNWKLELSYSSIFSVLTELKLNCVKFHH